MGLRERKRAQTVRKLLDAARTLMSERGYEATTIEAVAERAEVSVGTVYNYFDGKQELLVGVLADATTAAIEGGESLVADPDDDGQVAVLALMRHYAHQLVRLERTLLRQALALGFSATSDVAAEMFELDVRLMGQTARLVEALRQRGDIRADLPVEQVVVALYGTFAVAMMLWLGQPDERLDELDQSLQQQLSIVFRGLTPSGPTGGRS